MFIVATTHCKRDENGDVLDETMVDNWEVVVRYEMAQEIYARNLKDNDLYLANICVAVTATVPWHLNVAEHKRHYPRHDEVDDVLNDVIEILGAVHTWYEVGGTYRRHSDSETIEAFNTLDEALHCYEELKLNGISDEQLANMEVSPEDRDDLLVDGYFVDKWVGGDGPAEEEPVLSTNWNNHL